MVRINNARCIGIYIPAFSAYFWLEEKEVLRADTHPGYLARLPSTVIAPTRILFADIFHAGKSILPPSKQLVWQMYSIVEEQIVSILPFTSRTYPYCNARVERPK